MASTTQTILLVEDDANDILFVRMAMENAGIAGGLQIAKDGERAIEYLSGVGEFADRTRYPVPALVLLDVKLPRVMGHDVLKWIRQQPGLDMMLVIMLTASPLHSDISKACALGANSYLVKPSNPFDLNEIMELVKRYWLQLNHPTATVGATESLAKAAEKKEQSVRT